jgi:hypothetical protein
MALLLPLIALHATTAALLQHRATPVPGREVSPGSTVAEVSETVQTACDHRVTSRHVDHVIFRMECVLFRASDLSSADVTAASSGIER